MEELASERYRHEFTTTDGLHAIVRSIDPADAEQLMEYINRLSKEDTFVLRGGEEISLEEEKEYVKKALRKMTDGEAVSLVCTIDSDIISICQVSRKTKNKERSHHVGQLGISVDARHRQIGVGQKMMEKVLRLAQIHIAGLKMIELSVFGSNQPAINMYKKFGFKEVGCIPKGILHRGKFVDEVFMTKDLPDI